MNKTTRRQTDFTPRSKPSHPVPGVSGYVATAVAVLPFLAFSASAQGIDSSSTHIFPNALPGETIEVTKVADPVAGTIRMTSNSPRVRSGEDLVRLEKQEEDLLRKKHGALCHSSVLAKLETLSPGAKVDVVVSLRQPEGVLYLDKTKHSPEAMRQQSQSLLSLQPVTPLSSVLARHGLRSKTEMGLRAFHAEVTREQLGKLAFDNDVSSIEEFRPDKRPTGFPYPDLTSLARSAYNHSNTAVPSGAGYGVNAATFETGLDPTMIACWGGLNPAHLDQRTIPWSTWEHSHQTFRCLSSTAPSANLWHRNSLSYSSNESYIINNNIQTMSLSYENTSSVTNDEMRFIDDMAYRSPFPVFANPASNYGYNLVPDWGSYNAINVGNVRHTDQSHWELAGCTQTTNPPAIYGTRNDRELPMLVAPGISSSVNYPEMETCTGSTGWCGTSWSAPIVNGLAADVIGADTRMIGWPEKVRLALMATAQNVDAGYWTSTVDGRDGAGVVNGADAVAFAKGHSAVFPNNTPAVNGLGASSISPSDFNDLNAIFYKIQIPNPKPAGKHLRVVLTWDSNPTPVGSATIANPLSDLDLLVTNGSQGMASNSQNSNVEMVDIPNTMYAAGSVVDARIFKTVNRIPAGSRAQFFYYAVGWTWVKDHAD